MLPAKCGIFWGQIPQRWPPSGNTKHGLRLRRQSQSSWSVAADLCGRYATMFAYKVQVEQIEANIPNIRVAFNIVK